MNIHQLSTFCFFFLFYRFASLSLLSFSLSLTFFPEGLSRK